MAETSFPNALFIAIFGLAAGSVVLLLGGTLTVAMRLHKHAVIDTVWGLGFAVIALVAWLGSTGHGDTGRRLLALALTVVWGVRLAVHLGLRSRGHGEDRRYADLMAQSRGNPVFFAIRRIYLTQGLFMLFVSLPVQVAMFETPALGAIGWVGAAVWALGFGFETVGDWQLTRFRSDPESSGSVLQTGLWRYTRHPNYFGDAVVWWGLSLIAFDAWPGMLTVLSPVVMTWLLARGTGKPLLEKDIATRRPAYADYVRRTSGFVPWPPRRT